MSFLSRMFDTGLKELRRCKKIANVVMSYEEEYRKLTDEALQAKTVEFKERYKNGESLDSLLPEAYAVVREASDRVTNKRPFYVQVCGAIAIHGGNIAEMKTGEGKTLTAVMPAYLNALSGEGVHIVTVNEYLADREANGEIGDLFRFLGLTVGLNLRDLDSKGKQEAYNTDIMYSTHSELGFDYLRDNMVYRKEDVVQRPLAYAIIDEVDSILIDEARTPLIISGGAKNDTGLYISADSFVKGLHDEDFEIDIEAQTVALTQSGITRAERRFGIENLYDIKYVELVHHIDNALKANMIFKRDKQYMVSEEGEIHIIDQFTGRVLKGRQYSEGLHQAIEAKEGVKIKKETVTVATITYQNFFRMYKKLSGMTGTAKTEEEEFRNIYNMYVVEVPTNRPVIRNDQTDLLFATVEAKYDYMLEDIKRIHATGQPILIGTVAVETSELISKLLKKAGIKHDVLNAKNHSREAEIIANAGQVGAVTIATNMAGRGTDIKLGEGVKDLGGLAIIGTERHESRRIDNQLRGRSGRQGDPGSSRFYLSADDELLLRFGGETFKSRVQTMLTLGTGDVTLPLESKMFTRVVNNAQKRIEGNNFDSRKTVLKYDEVLRKQRETFYAYRQEVIKNDDINEIVNKLIRNYVEDVCANHIEEVSRGKYRIDDEAIASAFNGPIYPMGTLKVEEMKELDEVEVVDYVYNACMKLLDEKKAQLPDIAIWNNVIKQVTLKVLTSFWTKHIDSMSELRQSVRLQSYAQQNPLIMYQQVGYERFEEMMGNIGRDVTKYLAHIKIQIQMQPREEKEKYQTNQAEDQSLAKKPTKVDPNKKLKPNEPCSCGSGKKYKYCCGARQ